MSRQPESNEQRTVFYTNLDSKGRLLLPAKLREQAGFKEGDVLVVALDNNLIAQVSSLRQKIRSLRGILKSPGRKKSLVDEFIRERRQEALNE